MEKYKYVLFYSERNKIYRLTKVKNDGYNPKNPNVLWIFDFDKLATAKKILKNMNLATSTLSFSEEQLRLAS